MRKLDLLIGMIASGKSTYARTRAEEGALIICHDDLTTMLHGCYRYEPALKPAYRAMMVGLAFEAIMAGRDVIIDRTHLDRESRRHWLAQARQGSWPAELIAVVFPRASAKAHARRRFEADARGRSHAEWLAAALHHAAQAEAEPLDWEAEGFSSCTRIRGLTS
jgi:predicted kinase